MGTLSRTDKSAHPRAVLASGNRGKLDEIQAMLGDCVALTPQSAFGVESAEETGTTFEDNALLKARHASRLTGLPAIADDSGLEVDHLNGAPGVMSARFAGIGANDADNVNLLLERLAGVVATDRGARFRCVMVYVRDADDVEPLVAEGVWEGSIATAPAGDNGFGYDPVFLVGHTGRTAAELDPAEKNRQSHRGDAARQLRTLIIDAAGPDRVG